MPKAPATDTKDPVAQRTAKQVAAAINKKFAEDDAGPAVILASEVLHQHIRYISTGVLAVDAALGGGWAVNQWHEIMGDESSGKTALAYKTIAANQQLDKNFTTLWVASEEYVASYAAMCGVDNSRVMLVETREMETAMQHVLDFIAARSVDLVVIDSLPQLVPIEEDSKDLKEVQVALQARINAKFFRKVRAPGRRSLVREDRPVTGLIINQFRVKVGGWAPHGQEPTTTPGGRAKNFSYFSRLELKKTDTLKHESDKDEVMKKAVPVGQVIRAIVRKQKTGPPGRIAAFDYYFADSEQHAAGSIDTIKDTFLTGVGLGVIEAKGAMVTFGEVTHRGRPKFLAQLTTDEEFRTAIQEACVGEMRRRRGVPA